MLSKHCAFVTVFSFVLLVCRSVEVHGFQAEFDCTHRIPSVTVVGQWHDVPLLNASTPDNPLCVQLERAELPMAATIQLLELKAHVSAIEGEAEGSDRDRIASEHWVLEIYVSKFKTGFMLLLQKRWPVLETEDLFMGTFVLHESYPHVFMALRPFKTSTSSLQVSLSVRVIEDSCSVPSKSNVISECQVCRSKQGCGWCADTTLFAGCLSGTDVGPFSENIEPCGGYKMKSKEAPIRGWTYGPEGECPTGKEQSGDGYLVLTIVIVSIVLTFLLAATAVHLCRKRQQSLEDSAFSSLTRRTNSSSNRYSRVEQQNNDDMFDELDDDL